MSKFEFPKLSRNDIVTILADSQIVAISDRDLVNQTLISSPTSSPESLAISTSSTRKIMSKLSLLPWSNLRTRIFTLTRLGA
ncbi:hypothetical protein L3X38_009141 [Prunus dulcis]|uniref:Uncharacterized protein n=1 Tax=Prunus dulcis TaxID=3755 RepID=A0AAD4ZXZ7_PRUDU|nr:hypothetical protein L3X38_009141 [Prunus dulcis]